MSKPDKSRLLHSINGKEIYLDPTTWRLFSLLQESQNKPISSRDIYQDIWGNTPILPTFKIVSTYIWELRKCLRDTKWCVSSKFGQGFCFYTLQEIKCQKP